MAIIRGFVIVMCAFLAVSCSRVPYRVEGAVKVRTWENGDAYVPNAEMLLVHKEDTLRTITDEHGRFDFGELKYKTYIIDGRHAECGVLLTRALNRLRSKERKRTPPVFFWFSRVDSVQMSPVMEVSAVDNSQKRYSYFDYEMRKYNRRRLPPWVLVGYVADGRTMGGSEYAWPAVIPEAKVYVVSRRDTVCVRPDKWGRYAVWNIKSPDCYVWAESAGYLPSKPVRVWCDQMIPSGRVFRRVTHQYRSIALWPSSR